LFILYSIPILSCNQQKYFLIRLKLDYKVDIFVVSFSILFFVEQVDYNKAFIRIITYTSMYRKSKSINLKKIYIRSTYFMFYLVKVSPIAQRTSKLVEEICWNTTWILCHNQFHYKKIPKFQNLGGDQFYWWRKVEYPEKTTDLSQVTDNHNQT
jgi:hypothetical protein